METGIESRSFFETNITTVKKIINNRNPFPIVTIVAVGMLLGACSSSPVATRQQGVDPDKAGLLMVYGNWCGIEHPKDINDPPLAIDDLDEICMRHDYCYVEKGMLDCGCDKALRAELEAALLAEQFQGEKLHFARTFNHYFAGSPCNGDGDGKIAPSRLLHNAYGVAKKGVVGIFNKVTGSDNADDSTQDASDNGETDR